MSIIKEGVGWRLLLVPDDSYDDSYIDTWDSHNDRQKVEVKQEVWNRIEQEGVWCLVSEVKCLACHTWDSMDSVGGFIGEDWKGSDYEKDILEACQLFAKQRQEEVVKLMATESALRDCVAELERLRDLHLPQYEGKVGEPDKEVLDRARAALES